MKSETEKLLEGISRQLNVLISLTLRNLTEDKDLANKDKRKKGASGLVNYLASFSLDAKDIAAILGAPLGSVRTLLTPKRRKR